MDYFPIFLDLRRRRCLVVGGGEAASRKAAGLRQAGAEVVMLLPEEFAPAALEGVALVMVAGASLAAAEAIARAAATRCIPVNVMDEPHLCSFIMPAIVDRAPVMVAITSGGTAPLLAARLRQWLDAALPQRLGALASLAGRFRPLVRRRLRDPETRRRFWEGILSGNPARLALAGEDAAAGAALLQALDRERASEVEAA
jgi:uroporphyrin-III C-methyltransferase / precorrin-2 dehydrogenase / sirohydrochlorin ferrochelatase